MKTAILVMLMCFTWIMVNDADGSFKTCYVSSGGVVTCA